MKQVININFHGSVVPIEQSAYEILKQYIDSLKAYFINEPGRDEIVNDIETRIGELFDQRLKKGVTCITEEDVAAIKTSIGTPEDFAENDGETLHENTAGATGNDAGTPPFTRPSRLYRDENNKILGGVCSGLAHYFNLDVSLVRVIFLVLLFVGGFSILAYIIMWILVPSTASQQIGGVRKRLFRDPDSKLIGGICSGIAQYFGVNVWVPRLIFLLPLLTYLSKFGGDWHTGIWVFRSTSLVIYIILWLVLPEANTTAEKLEMKGEKVDLNTIKDSVVREMKDLEARASQLGRQDKNFLETGIGGPADMNAYRRSARTGIGNVIGTIIKVILYIFLGFIVVGILAALFGLTIASLGVFPLKDFILEGQTQNALAWGTLIFFIIVPLIGLITWIIRRLGKMRGHSRAFVTAFILLWVLGWACAMGLLSSVSKDFMRESNYNTELVQLSNPGVAKLELKSYGQKDYFNRRRMVRFQPFENFDDDTIYIPNVKVNIIKSENDSFRIEKVRFANGPTKQVADLKASKINLAVNQQDTLVYIDNGIPITRADKFRNQQVILNIFVPVGKHIKIDDRLNVGSLIRINRHGIGTTIDDDYDGFEHVDAQRGWQQGVEYVMRADGLYTLDGRNAEQTMDDGNINWDDRNWDENNWNEEKVTDSASKDQLKLIDSLKEQIKTRERKNRDSLQRMKDEIEEELRKMTAAHQSKEPFISTLAIFNPVF